MSDTFDLDRMEALHADTSPPWGLSALDVFAELADALPALIAEARQAREAREDARRLRLALYDLLAGHRGAHRAARAALRGDA